MAGIVVVLALAASASSAAGAVPRAETALRGAPGIGDPYFPLDGNGGIDVLRYRIADSYRFADRHLQGRTRVTLRALQDLATFNLDFMLHVRGVTVDGRRADFDQSAPRHELVIRPRRALKAGQKVDVVVRYSGFPGRLAYRGESNWLASRREVVTMNQPHMAPWWFPSNDHPQDKALMNFFITVPRGKQVVANGRQVSRRVHGDAVTYHWKSDEPMVPYLAFFAAGRFDVARGRSNGLPWLVAVSRLLPTGSQQLAMRMMRKTPRIVAWLQGALGPYPFGQTGGLVTRLQPGFSLENQTRPTYSVISLTTVVHELAHQWFGDSVAVRQWRDIWLNEGFASFMERAYAEAHGGLDAQQWLENTWKAYGVNDSLWTLDIADPGPNEIFAWQVYLRGSMAMQALRHRVGEDDFWTILRTWAADRAGGNGSVSDFRTLSEQVSGEDLDGFFDAWLTAGTKPAGTAENGLS